MLKVKRVPNEKFRQFADFQDAGRQFCSVVESTSVDPAIWLGVEGHQMFLDVATVKDLLPVLQHFVKTGRIK